MSFSEIRVERERFHQCLVGEPRGLPTRPQPPSESHIGVRQSHVGGSMVGVFPDYLLEIGDGFLNRGYVTCPQHVTSPQKEQPLEVSFVNFWFDGAQFFEPRLL